MAGNDIITHNTERKGFADECLAEFAAYYYRTNRKGYDKNINSEDEFDNCDDPINRHYCRIKVQTIRYARFKIDQISQNYFFLYHGEIR